MLLVSTDGSSRHYSCCSVTDAEGQLQSCPCSKVPLRFNIFSAGPCTLFPVSPSRCSREHRCDLFHTGNKQS